MGTNLQVKYTHANGYFVNSVKAGVPIHEGRQCTQTGLLAN
jgi:hypothetical protein